MSSLRDSAAGLVSKVRTQLLVESRGLAQSDVERRKAWAAIERDADALMAAVHRFEPVVDRLEGYAELAKFAAKGQPNVVVAEAASAVVKAVEAFVAGGSEALEHTGRTTPTQGRSGPPPAGWARAGDVQLPLGDRDPDPKAGGNPPP